MICKVCKKEWTGAPDDGRCPHCGAHLSKGADQHTIPGVIAFLIQKEGVDILLKPETVMSYIYDLVVGSERDKKMMRVGSANGIFQKIHAVLIEPKQSRREVMVLDIKQHLMDNAFLSEENAVAIVNLALEGAGLPSLRLPKPAERAKPDAVKSQPVKPAPEPKKRNAPQPASTNSRPVNSQQKTSADSGHKPAGKQFTLYSVSVFEYDGSSFAARKVQGPLFLKGETRMIGILVTYPAAQQNMKVSLDWQIFRQDGSPLTPVIHGTGVINKGDTDYFQGWGWNEPGNWAVGRYTVKASMNGSKELVTYFDVVEGRYDNPVLRMNDIRLFSAGSIPPGVKDRLYSVVFSSQQVRRIYFEISMAKISTPVYTTLHYKIVKLSGEILANYAVPIRFHAGDDKCWTGFGWDAPGHWPKGRYGYEVSIGEANNLFCGVFDVV